MHVYIYIYIYLYIYIYVSFCCNRSVVAQPQTDDVSSMRATLEDPTVSEAGALMDRNHRSYVVACPYFTWKLVSCPPCLK